MILPDNFLFTQNNLQDYQDCPRRFYLRYLLKQDWPAVESEPVKEQEELILMGEKFHLMAQQYFAGIPQSVIEASIEDPILSEWWNRFIQLDILSMPGKKISETLFTIPFAGFRLGAKIDLLLCKENAGTIVYDWKTSQHKPRSKWLSERMQTRVYPLVISTLVNSHALPVSTSTEELEMIYWYPAFPEVPVIFDYSHQKFNEDQTILSSMINEIVHLDESGFTVTPVEKMCNFCRYRSLCSRGTAAGRLSDSDSPDLDPDSAFDIDFDQISAAD